MNFRQFLRIVEIRTKIVSLSTFILFHLWYWGVYGHINLAIMVLSFFAVLAVDMGTTAFNSFFDYYKSVDSGETNRELDKVLVHEKVPPGYALLTALGLYFLAAILGIILVSITSFWLLVLGIFSLLVGFFYSGGPKPLSFTPFGEVFAGGFLGAVLWMVLWVSQTGSLFGAGWSEAISASIPSTLFIASILTVNNTCDQVGDKHAGRLTLSIILGTKGAEIIIAMFISGAYGIWLFMGLTGKIPLSGVVMSLIGWGISLPIFIRMHSLGYRHDTKGPQMGKISQLFLIFTIVMALTWFFRLV